jgi:sensor histidine kinase regulating citrate/malate metabolism
MKNVVFIQREDDEELIVLNFRDKDKITQLYEQLKQIVEEKELLN